MIYCLKNRYCDLLFEGIQRLDELEAYSTGLLYGDRMKICMDLLETLRIIVSSAADLWVEKVCWIYGN